MYLRRNQGSSQQLPQRSTGITRPQTSLCDNCKRRTWPFGCPLPLGWQMDNEIRNRKFIQNTMPLCTSPCEQQNAMDKCTPKSDVSQ